MSAVKTAKMHMKRQFLNESYKQPLNQNVVQLNLKYIFFQFSTIMLNCIFIRYLYFQSYR